MLLVSLAAFAQRQPGSARGSVEEELERQLQQMVQGPPPRLEIVVSTRVPLLKLTESHLWLDGSPVYAPATRQLDAPGEHRVFEGTIKPGSHRLAIRLAYASEAASVFRYAQDMQWKLASEHEFSAHRGVSHRLLVLVAERPLQTSPEQRLQVSYRLESQMLEAGEPLDAGAANAGPAAVVATADAGVAVDEGSLVVRLRGESGLLAGTVRVRRPVRKTIEVFSSGPEIRLPAGPVELEVIAGDQLGRMATTTVEKGQTRTLEIPLTRRKGTLVALRSGRFEQLQAVRFARGGAELHPSSRAVLDQVVDLMVRNDVRRIRIEGYTDNRGPVAQLTSLSSAFAESVARYLEKAGVSRSRMETAGLGPVRPLVPNVTWASREKNRRVEISVLAAGSE